MSHVTARKARPRNPLMNLQYFQSDLWQTAMHWLCDYVQRFNVYACPSCVRVSRYVTAPGCPGPHLCRGAGQVEPPRVMSPRGDRSRAPEPDDLRATTRAATLIINRADSAGAVAVLTDRPICYRVSNSSALSFLAPVTRRDGRRSRGVGPSSAVLVKTAELVRVLTPAGAGTRRWTRGRFPRGWRPVDIGGSVSRPLQDSRDHGAQQAVQPRPPASRVTGI
jgi:hypothetical protein